MTTTTGDTTMTTPTYTMDLSEYVDSLPDDVRQANRKTHGFYEDYDFRCCNCDCRAWGSWADLPCGSGPKSLPAHVAPHSNASARFAAGFAAYSTVGR